MCKNADNPCPGCKNHDKAEPAWMFFTDEERARIERQDKSEDARS